MISAFEGDAPRGVRRQGTGPSYPATGILRSRCRACLPTRPLTCDHRSATGTGRCRATFECAEGDTQGRLISGSLRLGTGTSRPVAAARQRTLPDKES